MPEIGWSSLLEIKWSSLPEIRWSWLNEIGWVYSAEILQCFTRDVNLDSFFVGLHNRMVCSQTLFEKSLKTGRYLRESCDIEKSDRGRGRGDRMREIEGRLTALGF